MDRIMKLYSSDVFEQFLEDPKCANCGKVATQRCSKCKNQWYCSRECQVKQWKAQEKRVTDVKKRIEAFLKAQAEELAEMLASEAPRYIRAARHPETPAEGLDAEVLARWVKYLKTGPVDNKYLQGWEKESFDLSKFRQEALAVLAERKKVDEKKIGRAHG